MTKTNRKNQGFTLLELLVVLVILGLLASLVGPQVIKQIGGSKAKTAALQIEEFGTALDLFHLEVGRYPSTSEGLEALIEKPSGARFWNGPYLKKKWCAWIPGVTNISTARPAIMAPMT